MMLRSAVEAKSGWPQDFQLAQDSTESFCRPVCPRFCPGAFQKYTVHQSLLIHVLSREGHGRRTPHCPVAAGVCGALRCLVDAS